MKCGLCRRELPANRMVHRVECDGEFFRRTAEGTCVKCGKRSGPQRWCGRCTAMDDPPWIGCPPGGAV